VVLDYGDLDRIGMAAGRTIPPMNVTQIVEYIDRLAAVRLGDIRLDFPVGQLEEIARLAAREHKDPAEYIGRIAATFLSNFFRLPAAAVHRSRWSASEGSHRGVMSRSFWPAVPRLYR
jgi:hypothetical protein